MMENLIETIGVNEETKDPRYLVFEKALFIMANRIIGLIHPPEWNAGSIVRVAIAEAESELGCGDLLDLTRKHINPDILWLTGLDHREREIVQNLVVRMLNYKTVVEQRDWLAENCKETK